MATTNTVKTPPTDGADDPFRYGWRYLRHDHPDGTETWERVPLTLDDVLHPQEDDFIVQNSAHEWLQTYLTTVFMARLAHDPTAVVLADVRIAWDVPGLRAHGPDVAVITGVRAIKTWGTFDVAVEGVRPALIIEITSPSTDKLDRLTKREQYESASVPTYIIIDLTSQGPTAPLLFGYSLGPTGYRVLPPDAQGRLWLEAVRVWLGVAEGKVVCFDESGQLLGDYVAVSAALQAETEARTLAEQRAEVEATARALAEDHAASMETRLRQLEAELARLRGEK
jgi:Uma2 family endonuclease